MTETSEQRSRTMRAVHSFDTSPELVLRRLLRKIGHPGYRLHRKDLPGKPDIAFIGLKKAIFVHGCFWHGHSCTRGNRIPSTNMAYWTKKIERNKARDRSQLQLLEQLGWNVFIAWECELSNMRGLTDRLTEFLIPTR